MQTEMVTDSRLRSEGNSSRDKTNINCYQEGAAWGEKDVSLESVAVLLTFAENFIIY
jgi:hypothetical protein